MSSFNLSICLRVVSDRKSKLQTIPFKELIGFLSIQFSSIGSDLANTTIPANNFFQEKLAYQACSLLSECATFHLIGQVFTCKNKILHLSHTNRHSDQIDHPLLVNGKWISRM